MEALQDLINYDDEPVERTEEWTIQDDDGAAWAVRKIRAMKEKITQIERLAEAEIMRVNRWAGQETQSDRDSISFFEGLLKEYHEVQLAEDPTRKTIKLPHGKLSARSLPDVLAYEDETFIAWATEHAPAMLTSPGIDKRVAKTLLESFEELPPGVSLEADRGFSFSVKTD